MSETLFGDDDKSESLEGEGGDSEQSDEAWSEVKSKKTKRTLKSTLKSVVNETLYGSEFPVFDKTISNKQAKEIAKNNENMSTVLAAQPAFTNVIDEAFKGAVQNQKKEELDKESIRCNIVLYGVEDKAEPDWQVRKKNDSDTVDEILAFLESEAKPIKMFRIGAFKATADDNMSPTKPRPLKIVLPDAATVNEVMKKCPKLKNSPEHLSRVNICYDMTKDERSSMKKLVEDAKTKSKNSPKWDFKVRGPPWNPKTDRFPKRGGELRDMETPK